MKRPARTTEESPPTLPLSSQLPRITWAADGHFLRTERPYPGWLVIAFDMESLGLITIVVLAFLLAGSFLWHMDIIHAVLAAVQ